jgi:hypothetical protein
MKNLLLTLCAFGLFTASSFSQSNVRLTKVDPDKHEVTLTNLGNVTQNIGTHWLCYFPDYNQINGLNIVSGSTNLTAGSSVTVIFQHCLGNTGEVGYYLSNVFASSAAMKDYIEWGAAGQPREGVAVGAGLWTAGQFVPNDPEFVYIGSPTDHGAAFWTQETYGCKETIACNYNSSATIDDGSCEYTSCAGCTYVGAENFNPLATRDDGTCVFAASCVGDFNDDGTVGTADLLVFVAAYGGSCN